MEGDYDTSQHGNDENGAEYSYPEGYDASNYADSYYQQQQEGENYYASYQQGEYDGYYSQQEGGQNGAIDQYQYNYDANTEGYDTYASAEVQDYNYYAAGDEQQLWGYNHEEGQQLYLDQLTTEQTTGYYYDEKGNLIGAAESPTNVFTQEAYWESGQDSNNSPYIEERSSQVETGAEVTETILESATTEIVATPEEKSLQKTTKKDKSGRAASPSRKNKTKKERVAQRQAVLEKEEEERLKALEAEETVGTNNNAPGNGSTVATKTSQVSKKKTGLVGREKAKFQMKLRIAKAIKRKRMPVQIRILPTTRKFLSPMDKYFEGKSVECVLSDIFWASMKGDIKRVKHLVEVEGESSTDSNLDPWNLHQTPLHWAAKGGSVPVINYLLAAGASTRCLDENGSLPLHLSCWAGHVQASIVLLRASDVKDLYVQDYDGAMCPLDWVNVRGHTPLLKAIEKYQDSLWLPKFVDDLIRGIIRYKIKIFKESPKKLLKVQAKDADANANPDTKSDSTSVDDPASTELADKPADEAVESSAKGTASPTKLSSTKLSLLKRAKTEKVNGKIVEEDKAASSKSLG